MPFSYHIFFAFLLMITVGAKVLEYVYFWFDLGQLLYLYIRFVLETSIIFLLFSEKDIIQTNKETEGNIDFARIILTFS